MEEIRNMPLALALSGGGIRAMAFHLGVLRLLAEKKLLERVSRISTVSGGSLIVGLIYSESSFTWPSSNQFLTPIYANLRTKLCNQSMVYGAFRQFIDLRNFRFLFSRASLLSLALKKEWGIDIKLSDIPSHPEWSINGTTAETGKRFRFKNDTFGDYILGYADAKEFPLADALAVSAAFPGAFGPLAISTANFVWRKQEKWKAGGTAKTITLEYEKLHIYDGGIYDNLGLEPFFDQGDMRAKKNDSIIVSDAGAPLGEGFNWGSMNPWRLKRVFDIMSSQSRALRIRGFTNYLKNGNPGAYFYISDLPNTPGHDFSISFQTTLRKLSFLEFDKLAGHGYEVANEYLRKYDPKI